MFKRFGFTLLTFISLLTFCTQAFVQQTTFRIGVEDVPYYPLFDFKTERNTFSRELLDEFAKQQGYTFIYVPLPIKRFAYWLLENKVDFKYPDNARWYADPTFINNFTFSEATVTLVAGTSVLTSDLNRPVKQFKSVGTLLGFYPTTWINQINAGEVSLHEDPSTLILIKQLLNRDVDGIDIEPSVINHHLNLLGKSSDEISIDRRFEYNIYEFYFSTIKHPKVIDEFNQFLINNQALVEQLKVKYKIIDHRPYLQ